MLAELERGPVAAAGADPGQLALRKKMVQQLEHIQFEETACA
jgi:hypothetical protein